MDTRKARDIAKQATTKAGNVGAYSAIMTTKQEIEGMGTTGLVQYVRGEFWPYVPESTCFAARLDLAKQIISKRNGARAVAAFERAVYAGRK